MRLLIQCKSILFDRAVCSHGEEEQNLVEYPRMMISKPSLLLQAAEKEPLNRGSRRVRGKSLQIIVILLLLFCGNAFEHNLIM